MKSNTIATAAEILISLGYEKPEDYVGKMRVRIGGIPIRSVQHLVRFPSVAETVEVIVGDKVHEIDVKETNEEPVVSPAAKQVLKKHGEEVTKQSEEMQERKKAAKKGA